MSNLLIRVSAVLWASIALARNPALTPVIDAASDLAGSVVPARPARRVFTPSGSGTGTGTFFHSSFQPIRTGNPDRLNVQGGMPPHSWILSSGSLLPSVSLTGPGESLGGFWPAGSLLPGFPYRAGFGDSDNAPVPPEPGYLPILLGLLVGVGAHAWKSARIARNR